MLPQTGNTTFLMVKNGLVVLRIRYRLGKSLGKSEFGLVLGHSAGGLRRRSANVLHRVGGV
ncbi:MAG: hypothetical protein RIS24_3126 [Verrucomicrobiota bacterium]|jgi:hypothetical protein